MKIALFTDSYKPNTDGVVSSILAYKGGLEKKGHSLYIFAPDGNGAEKEKNVYRYASLPFPPYPDYRAPIFPYVPADIAKKNGMQLVHSKAMVGMGLAALSFASRAKLPAMASLETMVPDGVHYLTKNGGMQKFGKRVAWHYLRWFYSNFRIVTAPSKHAQKILEQNGIKSEVLPSPIDTSRFKPNSRGAKVKKSLGLSSKKLVVSVGRVVREKNYSFLIRVAGKMKADNVAFLIVGKGPYLEELKQEAAKAGVTENFRFAGFVPGNRLVDYYNASDAFVFPSQFETQGLTLLEAFSCGKPACVLEGTPMEEIVKNGKNGYIFSDDEKECAEKLLACIEKGGKFSPAARKTALDYSIPKCTERLLKTYRRLLE